MSYKVKIETLQSKIECMVLQLGGRPDEDKVENKNLLDQFEQTKAEVQSQLKQAHQLLLERNETIKMIGFNTKERVVIDEDIKDFFNSSEQLLIYLRDVFKAYQKKNQRRVPPEDIQMRSKAIDILRNNLNLLKAEFNTQMERNQVKKVKQGGKKNNKDFVDLFGINNSHGEFDAGGVEEDDERALTGEEKDLLKQFSENDAELEEIAAQIVAALDQVKGVAEDIEQQIDKQGKMLRETRARADKSKVQLNQQNNDLKNVLEKHKSGKQCFFDLGLLCVWLVLFGFTVKVLQVKNYI